MLALTIREKNGEERQLIFEKEEVTIGRATGSDIVLPRSNISKRHARLVDKHDKVVIVDLRSTNGTYVNGRRITAPELLTHDDKVYIGDFVIRLSNAAEQAASERMSSPYTASATPEGPRAARAATAAADPLQGQQPHERALAEPKVAAQSQRAPARSTPPGPPPPDDEEDRTRAIPAAPEEEPEPPPKKPHEQAAPSRARSTPPAKKELVASEVAQALAPEAPVGSSTQRSPAAAARQRAEAQASVPSRTAAPSTTRAARPPEEPATRIPPAALEPAAAGVATEDPWADWNAAIQTVVERIERAHEEVRPGDAPVIAADAVEQAIEAGDIARETEGEALINDVLAELVGLGAIAETLVDPTVLAIFMNGAKSVFTDRGAGVHEPNGRLFATTATYRRTLQKLAGEIGLDDVVDLEELTLAGGAALRLVRSGAASEPFAVWRRAAREAPVMQDLAAEGLLDLAQAHTITQAIVNRRSILVCGASSPERSALAAAMVGEVGLHRRVVAVGDGTEVAIAQPDQAHIDARSLFGGTTVLGLEPDLVVFERIDAQTVGDWIEICLTAGKPVLALCAEPYGERALDRLGLLLDLVAQPGATRGRAIVGEAVDLIVSLSTQADGAVVVDKLQEVEGHENGFALKAPARR